jgi:hypothetical protein
MTTTAIHPTRQAAAERSHWTRRRLALAAIVATLAAAAGATPLLLTGSAGPSETPAAAAPAVPEWTPFGPWFEAVDVRGLKRQLLQAGYQVKVDDSLDPLTKSALADYLLPGSAHALGPALDRALRGTVILGRQNPVAWNLRFGLHRPSKFAERPLTGHGGQLDANGNIRP